jgi:hypothetical protein
MAIEALYPSRLQSRRHNPLFARERRLRRLGVCLVAAAGLVGVVGLRSVPAGAAAEAGYTPADGHGQLSAPFALRRAHLPEPAATTTAANPAHPIRVIPIFAVPQESSATPRKAG